jgi:predicted regulator of Ras-like GTPase activity (Roadblock/LC7/MglB family)
MDFAQRLRQERLVFYEEDIEEINKILTDFLEASQAKCVLMIDKEGHMVTKKGFTKSFDTDSIAALVAGSFASTREVAKLLGEREFTVLFHQGKNENIHVSLCAERALLVTIFDDRTTVGMVRLYAEQLTQKVADALMRAMERHKEAPAPTVGAEFEAAADQRLDDFFGGKEEDKGQKKS